MYDTTFSQLQQFQTAWSQLMRQGVDQAQTAATELGKLAESHTAQMTALIDDWAKISKQAVTGIGDNARRFAAVGLDVARRGAQVVDPTVE